MVALFSARPEAGVVGTRILSSEGVLEEAGGDPGRGRLASPPGRRGSRSRPAASIASCERSTSARRRCSPRAGAVRASRRASTSSARPRPTPCRLLAARRAGGRARPTTSRRRGSSDRRAAADERPASAGRRPASARSSTGRAVCCGSRAPDRHASGPGLAGDLRLPAHAARTASATSGSSSSGGWRPTRRSTSIDAIPDAGRVRARDLGLLARGGAVPASARGQPRRRRASSSTRSTSISCARCATDSALDAGSAPGATRQQPGGDLEAGDQHVRRRRRRAHRLQQGGGPDQ